MCNDTAGLLVFKAGALLSQGCGSDVGVEAIESLRTDLRHEQITAVREVLVREMDRTGDADWRDRLGRVVFMLWKAAEFREVEHNAAVFRGRAMLHAIAGYEGPEGGVPIVTAVAKAAIKLTMRVMPDAERRSLVWVLQAGRDLSDAYGFSNWHGDFNSMVQDFE